MACAASLLSGGELASQSSRETFLRSLWMEVLADRLRLVLHITPRARRPGDGREARVAQQCCVRLSHRGCCFGGATFRITRSAFDLLTLNAPYIDLASDLLFDRDG